MVEWLKKFLLVLGIGGGGEVNGSRILKKN